MYFVSWINNSFNSVLEWLKIKKPQDVPKPEAAKPAPQEPAKLAPKEAVKVDNGSQGTATVKVGMTTEQMVENWKNLAADPKAKKLDLKIESKSTAHKALMNKVDELVAKKELTFAQRDNVHKFMKEVSQANGKVTDSDNQNLVGRSYIDIIQEGLTKDGLTRDQLEAIGDDEFNFEAYAQLVKQGDPIG